MKIYKPYKILFLNYNNYLDIFTLDNDPKNQIVYIENNQIFTYIIKQHQFRNRLNKDLNILFKTTGIKFSSKLDESLIHISNAMKQLQESYPEIYNES